MTDFKPTFDNLFKLCEQPFVRMRIDQRNNNKNKAPRTGIR